MTQDDLLTLTTKNHLNAQGRAESAYGKWRLEVLGALASETIEAKICYGGKYEKVAITTSVLTPSPDRQESRCQHFPSCGGCSLQHMRYAAQLRLKQAAIEELFCEFKAEIFPIIPCDTPWQYRNKMEFSFSQDKAGNKYLGLNLAGSRGRVFNLTECHLVNPWMPEVLAAVRFFFEKSALQAYRRDDSGSLRTLTLREGLRTQEKLAMLTVSGNPAYALTKADLESFKKAITDVVGEEISLFLNIQQIAKKQPTQFFEMHLSGKDHLLEKMTLQGKEYTFKISPTSFFQPNTAQAEKLYNRALEMVQGKNPHLALDLFSGTSTFSIALSLIAKKVIAIELNPHAVFDAKENLEVNQITSVSLLQGDVKEKLKEITEIPDLVVLDPPRAGCGPQGLEILKGLFPKTILYISCNPQTQKEDIRLLLERGYLLTQVQPVDQFPHTMHTENICVLERKD